MKIKILFFCCIFLVMSVANALSWTLNQAVSGVDGQTVGAESSVEGSIDLETLGYNMIVLVCQCTSEVDVTNVEINVYSSVDDGATISNDYIDYDGAINPKLLTRIYHYPYVKIIVTNETVESGANDDTVVYCKYAVY